MDVGQLGNRERHTERPGMNVVMWNMWWCKRRHLIFIRDNNGSEPITHNDNWRQQRQQWRRRWPRCICACCLFANCSDLNEQHFFFLFALPSLIVSVLCKVQLCALTNTSSNWAAWKPHSDDEPIKTNDQIAGKKTNKDQLKFCIRDKMCACHSHIFTSNYTH